MIKPEVTAPKINSHDRPLVYIVDDEAMLLELASVILEPLGYELCTFRDPQAALDAFARAEPRPDLLITDYAMHNMNGMELIEQCRRREPDLKVLLVSGTVGIEVFEGAPFKPDRFLAKPYYARQLIELVKGMLAS
jgi:two-component system cell cycle sensor histidine kinase/response regulator CckA